MTHVKEMYQLIENSRILLGKLRSSLLKFNEMSKKYPEGNTLYDADLEYLANLYDTIDISCCELSVLDDNAGQGLSKCAGCPCDDPAYEGAPRCGTCDEIFKNC